jgi:hypothetical protein
MMSIANQFGKKNGRKAEPEVTMPRLVETKPLNSGYAEALDHVNQMVETIDFLQEENRQLRQDGALALMRIKDLEREAAARGLEMEGYRRYSCRVQTHLEHIADCCTRANQDAMEAGEHAPPPMPDTALATIVEAIADELKITTEAAEEGAKS